MAKFLFIQDILFDYFGPMYISAALKSKGHSCDLLVLAEEKNIFAKIAAVDPQAILISTMTGPHKTYLQFIKELKKRFQIPVVMGGPHPTFFPEVLKNSEIDYICVGEGEGFINDFADAIISGKNVKTIPNLGYKKRGACTYNPVRNLVSDLDSIPFADRDLYYHRYPQLMRYPTRRFFGTRGCPYKCTFCFNHAYILTYAGKGIYIRRRSAENIIQEILEVYMKYPFQTVRFPDDSFTINKQWLLNFLSQYKKKIILPFTCLTRGNELDKEVVSALKAANCINVFFGIETGNEKYRNEILFKALTNRDIIRAAKNLRKYKISYGTYNMIGLPGETLEDAFNTIRLNAKIKSQLPTCSILQPYPKTAIAEYATHHGYLQTDYSADDFNFMTSGSILKIPFIKELVNLNSFFLMAVRFPKLIPVIKILIKLPPNPLFRTLSFFSMGFARLKAQNLSYFEGAKLAVRFFRHI